MNTHTFIPASPSAHMMHQRLWSDGSRQVVVCQRVIDETHDVRTFVLTSKSGRLFSFKAGQYVLVHLRAAGTALTRAYSVASPPTRPLDLQITVKRTPGGVVSNWLHQNLKEGNEIEVEGPIGEFNFDDLPSDKPLFLSGGSGITPVMSMLRALTDRGFAKELCFVHSARTPTDIIFRSELEALAARFPNVHVHCVCAEGGDGWAGKTGLMDAAMLLQLVPNVHQRTIYACGPEPYMAAIRSCLRELCINPSQFHEESFGGAGRPSPPVDANGGVTSSVHFAQSGKWYDCGRGETILEAAREVGVFIPSACQQGICGTCRVTKVSGEVEMRDFGTLTAEQVAGGAILACCSRPRGAVSVDL
jgi:ferredoxin-NADP reductase